MYTQAGTCYELRSAFHPVSEPSVTDVRSVSKVP